MLFLVLTDALCVFTSPLLSCFPVTMRFSVSTLSLTVGLVRFCTGASDSYLGWSCLFCFGSL